MNLRHFELLTKHYKNTMLQRLVVNVEYTCALKTLKNINISLLVQLRPVSCVLYKNLILFTSLQKLQWLALR